MVTPVSSMDALIPGSRLRSEIDIARGESAARIGEEAAVLKLIALCEVDSIGIDELLERPPPSKLCVLPPVIWLYADIMGDCM